MNANESILTFFQRHQLSTRQKPGMNIVPGIVFAYYQNKITNLFYHKIFFSITNVLQ